jgi:hypothetical protein
MLTFAVQPTSSRNLSPRWTLCCAGPPRWQVPVQYLRAVSVGSATTTTTPHRPGRAGSTAADCMQLSARYSSGLRPEVVPGSGDATRCLKHALGPCRSRGMESLRSRLSPCAPALRAPHTHALAHSHNHPSEIRSEFNARCPWPPGDSEIRMGVT